MRLRTRKGMNLLSNLHYFYLILNTDGLKSGGDIYSYSAHSQMVMSVSNCCVINLLLCSKYY